MTLTEADFEPLVPACLIEDVPIIPYNELVTRIQMHLGAKDPMVVVLDFRKALWPYRANMHALVEAMTRAWPDRDMSLRVISGTLDKWRDYVELQDNDPEKLPSEYPCPVIPTDAKAILIVSDLGQFATGYGCTGEWNRYFVGYPLLQERQTCLILSFGEYNVHGAEHMPWSEPNKPFVIEGPWFRQGVVDLLTLSSVCLRIDPPLLRALRRILPGYVADDSGLEGAFWTHPAVDADFTAKIKAGHRATYSEQFRNLAPELQKAVFELMQLHHAHLRRSVGVLEALSFSAHASDEVLACSDVAAAVGAAEAWWNALLTITPDDPLFEKRTTLLSAFQRFADPVMHAKYPLPEC